MTETQTIQLFKCLADKSRLQILKSLAKEDMYVELLAQRLDLTPATISFHLKKLADVGAVTSCRTQYYTMYSLCKEVFMTRILDLICTESDEEDVQQQREEAYRQRVIASFFEDGKLKSIPTQRKKERIVLEEMAKVFQPGRRYAEREVNVLISEFHEDFCTIRRDMISEKLLEREGGQYWIPGSLEEM